MVQEKNPSKRQNSTTINSEKKPETTPKERKDGADVSGAGLK